MNMHEKRENLKISSYPQTKCMQYRKQGLQKIKGERLGCEHSKKIPVLELFLKLKNFKLRRRFFTQMNPFTKLQNTKRDKYRNGTLGIGKTELLYPLLYFQLPSNPIYKTLRCQ